MRLINLYIINLRNGVKENEQNRLITGAMEKSIMANSTTNQAFGVLKNNFCFLLFDLYFYRLQKKLT